MIDTLNRVTSDSSGAPKVLLVEDDLEYVGLLFTKFRGAAIETFHAKSGQEAIQTCQSILPDLIFLGLNLPEDDGLTLVDWLRSHNRLGQVPLVIYTIKQIEDPQRERLTLGRTEFLTKGEIGLEEIAQRVANLLMEVVPQKPAEGGGNGARPEYEITAG